MAQPRPALHDGLEHLRGAVAILDRSTVHDEADQQPAGVGHDVALAAIDLFAGVEAPDTAAFGGLNGLAVDDAGGRACLPTLLLPRRHDEGIVNGPKHTHVAPGVEIVLHRGEGWKVLREHAPLAPRRSHVEDRIHHLAQVCHARSPDRLRSRQQRGYQRPFLVAQVTCVASAPTGIVATGDISPRHRALHRIFANPTESQPTDITQFFLGQALNAVLGYQIGHILGMALEQADSTDAGAVAAALRGMSNLRVAGTEYYGFASSYPEKSASVGGFDAEGRFVLVADIDTRDAE